MLPICIPNPAKHQQQVGSSELLLDKVLLWVFSGQILRVSLGVKRKIWTIFLFDAIPLLVSMRVLPPVQVSGSDSKAGQNHEDDDSYDACNVEKIIMLDMRDLTDLKLEYHQSAYVHLPYYGSYRKPKIQFISIPHKTKNGALIIKCLPTEKDTGQSSFCMNYCMNAAWHGSIHL